MPLTLMKAGEKNYIKRIGGKSETRQFLENLGFVVGVDHFENTGICRNVP